MKIELNCFAVWRWWRHVTLEPSITLLYLSIVMSNMLFTNLFLQKTCRFSATVEPDLMTPCDDEVAGQHFVTEVNAWRNSVKMYLMIAFTVLSSSWSDKAGRRRRPLIFIPLVGQLLVSGTGCLFSYFWQWPAMSAVVLEALIHGVTGARFSLLSTSQMYICDITTPENRTTRLGILAALHILSVQIASGVTGFLLRRTGFFYSFCVCAVMSALSIVLGMLLIKDTSIPVVKKMSFWQALNPVALFESFKIVFKKRPFNRRCIIILLLVIDGCSLFPVIGESTVLYLYLRFRFDWNEEEYSLYIFYKLMIIALGTIFSAVVLSKYLRIHDGCIGVFSSVSSLLAAFFYIFADSTWQLYSISALEFLRAAPVTVISAFLTKCLEKDETGHLMSIRAIISLLTPLGFPVYNYIYTITMHSFPSAFFIVTVVAYVPGVFLFGIAYYLNKQTNVAQISHP